jgi:hypothetical protein
MGVARRRRSEADRQTHGEGTWEKARSMVVHAHTP